MGQPVPYGGCVELDIYIPQTDPSLHLSILVNGHHPSHKVLLYCVIFTKVLLYNSYISQSTVVLCIL